MNLYLSDSINSTQGRFRRLVTAVAVITLLGIIPVASKATPIAISGDTGNSTEGLGNFSGTLDYSASSASDGHLTLSLTNTSPNNNGGFITGLVLNNPDDSIMSIDSTVFSNSGFSLLSLTDNGINGPPFGRFDFGAALGGSFTGGGSPNGGISAGNSANFTFNFSGSGLDNLTSQSFIDELSSNKTKAGQFSQVRFKGFTNGGSDKVPGSDSDPPAPSVPEPGTLGIFGLGLIGLGMALRRNRSPR